MALASADDVRIRRARPDDVDAALDLYTEVAAEGVHIGGEAPIDRRARRQRWLESYARTDSATFLAETEHDIVGLATAEGRQVAELSILLAPAWRRRGIGTRLMEATIAWAHSVGAHKVSLQVWPHNLAAIRLYERFGFVQEGYLRKHYRRRNGDLWDAVVMTLLLVDD